MNNFKKLIVWQRAREFVKDIYQVTGKFPKEELFGLTSQIRRATISIALNIVEGSGRGTNKDFAHFLDVAFGSALEVEAQIILSLDLEFITNEESDILNLKIQEIQKMIKKLTDSLRNESKSKSLVSNSLTV
jgi:four helix bundle protein